jgi:hypothetical protein
LKAYYAYEGGKGMHDTERFLLSSSGTYIPVICIVTKVPVLCAVCTSQTPNLTLTFFADDVLSQPDPMDDDIAKNVAVT